jgi:hypothetical protein
LADAFAAIATELRRIEFPAAAQAEAAELGTSPTASPAPSRSRPAPARPRNTRGLAADNQELGNTLDQQERTLVSSLSG